MSIITINKLVKSFSALIDCSHIGLVIFSPEASELVHSEFVDLPAPAQHLVHHQPFEVVQDGEENLDQQDGCCIHTDGQQNYTLLCLSGHEEVNVQENEGQECIVEQPILLSLLPVCDEAHFLNQIPENTMALVSFGPPGYVVDIAEGVDQHDM